MRALRLLTIVMGVLIVAGVAVVVVTIVRRTSGAGDTAGPWSVTLEEPRGTSVIGVAAAGVSLAVALHGASGDHVVVVDPRTGRVVGRVMLTPGVAP